MLGCVSEVVDLGVVLYEVLGCECLLVVVLCELGCVGLDVSLGGIGFFV